MVDVRQGRHCPSQLSSHLAYIVLLQAPSSGRSQRDCCGSRPCIQVFDNASHHLYFSLKFSRTKWTRRPSGPALWGKVQTIWRGCCSATHRERTLYWILGKLFSNSLPASCSITHERVDAENIGFLLHPAPFYRPRHPDRARRFVQQSVCAPLHSWHVHPLLGLF